MITMGYIDPSTTGQIIAILTGVSISIVAAVGIMRTRIMMFFQKQKIARMEKKILKEKAQGKSEEK